MTRSFGQLINSFFLQEEIKKTHTGSKINGGIPTELATVYTHLATGDLQVNLNFF